MYEWPHADVDEAARAALKAQLEAILDLDVDAFPTRSELNRAIYNTGGLAIKAGSSAVVKTVNTIYGQIGATLFSKTAADMAALAGTVTADKFNVYVFMIDAAGTLTTSMGTEGATLGAVVFPTVATTKAVIGFVIINPTGTGNFVGGTTPLDDGTVTPNAVYVNTVGAFVQPE